MNDAPTQRTLNRTAVGPKGTTHPEKLVILLHGRDSSGEDMMRIARPLSDLIATARFVAPDAPNPGEGGDGHFRWIESGGNDVDAVLAAMAAPAAQLDAFINEERDSFGLADGDVALVGYASGAMMALHVGLRRENALAGILGFSGQLVGGSRLAGEIRSHPPVYLIHGEDDKVIPVDALLDAIGKLMSAGVDASSHVCRGLGHGINEEGARRAARFLATVLSGPSLGQGLGAHSAWSKIKRSARGLWS